MRPHRDNSKAVQHTVYGFNILSFFLLFPFAVRMISILHALFYSLCLIWPEYVVQKLQIHTRRCTICILVKNIVRYLQFKMRWTNSENKKTKQKKDPNSTYVRMYDVRAISSIMQYALWHRTYRFSDYRVREIWQIQYISTHLKISHHVGKLAGMFNAYCTVHDILSRWASVQSTDSMLWVAFYFMTEICAKNKL